MCDICPAPTYTREARAAGVEGAVLLSLTILPDGTVTNVRLVRGLGSGLDERAIEAVKGWRFNPILGPEGKPVTVEMKVEVNFVLKR